MDVVYALDKKYAPHAAASIASLLFHDSGRVRVFVLSYALPAIDKAKLESMGEVFLIDTGDFSSRLKDTANGDIDAGRFSLATYIRLFATEFLPHDVTRYLYLDSDTLVLSSIEPLFSFDMGSKPLAMAPEPTIYKSLKKGLGIDEDEPYFNAGVMLVDRSRWEKNDCEARCLSYLSEHNGSIAFHDQDIINAVLKDEIAALFQKYDFFSNYHYRSYASLVRHAPWYAALETKASYGEDPVIVHFAGDERPWYKGSHNPYRKEYLRYLALTPYSSTPLEEGHELYMQFYHLMNLATKTRPGLRDFFSEKYFKGRS